MQGFVLISINQTLNNESTIKSYPKISKQVFLSFLFNLVYADYILVEIRFSILGSKSRLTLIGL